MMSPFAEIFFIVCMLLSLWADMRAINYNKRSDDDAL